MDTFNNRIQKFDASGTYLLKWGTFGTGAGQFSLPTGVAVDSSDKLYVTDLANDRLQKFRDEYEYHVREKQCWRKVAPTFAEALERSKATAASA